MFRVLFLILFLMSSFVFAQTKENNQQEKKAYIFAELGKSTDFQIKQTYEEFYVKLKNESNLQGCLINYGTSTEVARREKQLRKSHKFRDYDSPMITFVGAGNIGKLKSIFWIVPTGAEPPTP